MVTSMLRVSVELGENAVSLTPFMRPRSTT